MSDERQSKLESAVPGLDVVLGGGLPEGDTLLLIGPPGSGKTTFVFQLAFGMPPERPVVYVSTLSEPAAQILRHLRSFSFWDDRQIGEHIVLQAIDDILDRSVGELVAALCDAVDEQEAGMLIVDGFASIYDAHPSPEEVRRFTNRLGVEMAARRCTTLLTSSKVTDMREATSPEFTICDTVLELEQRNLEERGTRSLRAWKVRGSANLLGRHTARIDGNGLAIYPRFETLPLPAPAHVEPERIRFGSAELDEMMSGGVPRGSITVVAGAPGTGKTLVALQFLLQGVEDGEPGVMLSLRETERQLEQRAEQFGHDLAEAREAGRATILRYPPVDLEIDVVLCELQRAIERVGARRVVIDSAAELADALTDAGRQRSVFAALTEQLRARGVSTLLTRDISQIVGPELDFADSPLEVLAENVLLLRFVEFRGELARIASILKMRLSDHDRSIRQYRIESGRGLRVLAPEQTVGGLLSGIAKLPSEQRVKRREPSAEEHTEQAADAEGKAESGSPGEGER